MSRFELMENFVRVVDAGSITGAADGMNIAKSAVSRRLAELESHLGVQLLNRTTRSITVTDTGKAYYEQCVRILADVEEVEASVSDQAAKLAGRLRIACPHTFGMRHLAGAINDFLCAHRGVQADIDFNDRRSDLIQEGFDVAVRIGDLADSTLIARRLADIRHVVCASPSYLEANGVPETPEQLREHSILQYNLRAESSWSYLTPGGAPGRVNVRPSLLANSGDFLVDAAVSGHGIILEPTFIAYEALRAGTLVPVLDDYEWPSMGAWAVYPPTRHLSMRVRAFVDFLADRFSGVPYWDRAADDDPHAA